MALWLPLVLAGLVASSQLVTNPEDLSKRFAQAQRLLATGDFAGARQVYESVLAVPDGALLRASDVRVAVDERRVGVQAAARYQLANLARKQAQLWHKEAALANAVEADSLTGLATAALREAAGRFAALRDEEAFELRQTAAYMVVDCLFATEDYADAAAAGQMLLELFPHSRYASRTRYTLGWAFFRLKEYEQAVAAFRSYTQGEPEGIRADRARLQTGLALEELARYEEALAVFELLADSYDPAGMDYEEKTAVALAGLREGQSRRSMAAKAWIKRGDMLKALGRSEEALTAYKKVSRDFSQESHLAEMAWVRQALLARETQGADASLAVYRYAAEKAERPGFRARMQAGLMSLLFDEGHYQEALASHRLYLTAHGEFVGEAGVSTDEAVFRVAECLRFLGEESAVSDSAQVLFKEALAQYGQVLEQAESYLVPEALFWQGHLYQALDDPDAALERFERLVAGEADPELGCRALLQIARLRDEHSDVLYEQILEQCQEEEVRAFAALELGHRHRRAGRVEEARTMLESIDRGQPQYGYAQMELAQIYVQDGHNDKAIELIAQQLAPATDADLQAQFKAQLGLLHQGRGEHDRALPLLAEALPHLGDAMRASARFGLGWSLYKTERYEEAWAEWIAALEEGALDDTQRRTLLRALGLCAQALEDTARVEPVYRSMLENEATRAEGLLGLGQFYLDQGNAGQAAAPLRSLLVHRDRVYGLPARLLLGKALSAQDSLAAAQAVLGEALALEPPPELAAELHFELGSVALGQRDYEAAAMAFRATLEQRPRRPVRAATLFYLGHSLQAQGKKAAARAHFEELIAAYSDQPQAPEAALLIGELHYGDKEYEHALEYYERVVGDWPASKDAPEALYGAAWCHLEMERIEDMQESFLRLARDYSGHERAHIGLLHLGDYYYNGRKFAKATQLYTQVVERFPETEEALQARRVLIYLADIEADSLYTEGMVLYDRGEFAQAIAVLQEVIERYPSTPSEAAARCNIGVSHHQLGDWRQAAKAYERAVTVLEGREKEWRALEFARSNRAEIGRTYFGEEVVE